MLEPASLPPGWTAQLDEAQERRYYVHAASDTVKWSHPRLGYYKGIVFMESGGLAQMMENIEADPPAESDVAAMAEYLSIRDADDPLVKEVALFASCAPLPPSFAEEEDGSGAIVFRHASCGVVACWRYSDCSAYLNDSLSSKLCTPPPACYFYFVY